MLKTILRIMICLVVGGVVGWSPDVALHLRRRLDFSRSDVLLVSVLMPGFLLVSYVILKRLLSKRAGAPSIAFFMLVGVWLLGSLAMMIGATPTGGGFSTPDTWAVILLGLLPPYTFIMATYDASLLGLMFASLLMLMVHVAFEREHWILPTRLTKWLRLYAT